MLTPGRQCQNQIELQDTQLVLLKIAWYGENPTNIWWPEASEVKFSMWVVKETHKSAFSFTPALDYMKTASALKEQRTILKGLERGAKHR